MFLDTRDPWPPAEPWRPAPPAPRLTKRGERVVGWVIGFNLLMLLVGPLAGSSVIDAVMAIMRS
ncbi:MULTISPECIES: hypothetical protein [Sphingomonas]|uniref:Uncharacterized protein n=1 Tax=Sphingomonas cynarae TaxID=930197 RepID=A0ABP7ETR4_9SPHN|nr:hypothetical protein [Sphingomonas sp. CFBP 8760]MBD8547559.1 hypothetical protein [Sphingomonas sp. CFBP 8760]